MRLHCGTNDNKKELIMIFSDLDNQINYNFFCQG